MISYNLHLPASNLTIEPQGDGRYQILDGDDKLGVIFTETSDKRMNWVTNDPLKKKFVQKMGALIKEHQI
ncbi:hypothetical protein [Pedobacter sp. GR22-6]|uniref:hypothetical protein n=1 Tax=Pedobacter sp. GR22-6 TaxID=3127957 RepID=UPI00307EB5F7